MLSKSTSASLIPTLRVDLAFGIRLLRRSPVFTLVVVGSLGIGIGLNTAVFSLFSALLQQPVPGVADPSRLVTIHTQMQGSSTYLPVSYLNFKDLQKRVRSLSGLASYQLLEVTLAGDAGAEQVPCQLSSWNYFEVLGVRPQVGRFFLATEDLAPGSHPVVVLSHGLWQRRFAGDAHILGRQILINRHPFTVVGVAAAGFRGINALAPAQLWVPTMMYRELATWAELLPTRDNQMLLLFGRLRDGVSVAQAGSDLRVLAAGLAAEYPNDNRNLTLVTLPLRESMIHPNRRGVFVQGETILLCIGGVLLLLSCLNVANLLLVRAVRRQKELALRECLGADRGRLVRQLLTEAGLLTLIAGATGIVLAFFGARLLWSLRPPFLVQDILVTPLDGRALVFAVVAALSTGLLFGSVPALYIGRCNLTPALRGGPQGGERRWHLRLGDLLVTLQVALCFVGLVGTTFFTQSLLRAQQIQPGFDTDRLATFSFNLLAQGLDEPRGRAFGARLRAEVASLPGAALVAMAENRVLSGAQILRNVQTEPARRGSSGAADSGFLVRSNAVDSRFFATIGLPVVDGRPFNDGDRTGARPVAIVSRALAKRLWPGRSPVGESIHLDQETTAVSVVGVAQDMRLSLLETVPPPVLYLPTAQRYTPLMTLHVRATGNPSTLLTAARHKLRAENSSLPEVDARLASEIVTESLWWPRLSTWLLTVFTALALSLVAMGVYGLTAYQVSLRNFELGVRLSLGAERVRLVGLLIRQGCQVAALGLLLGAISAFALQGWMASLLYGGAPASPARLVGLGLVMLLISLIANLLPALRVVQMEPTALLRTV